MARRSAGGIRSLLDQEDHTPYHILKDPLMNKGTSFTAEERNSHHLHGLIPGGEPQSLELKCKIAMIQFHKKTSPLEKYNFLHTIQDSDETLFCYILIHHINEAMPIVYTPTVGQACTEWSYIYRQVPRGKQKQLLSLIVPLLTIPSYRRLSNYR